MNRCSAIAPGAPRSRESTSCFRRSDSAERLGTPSPARSIFSSSLLGAFQAANERFTVNVGLGNGLGHQSRVSLVANTGSCCVAHAGLIRTRPAFQVRFEFVAELLHDRDGRHRGRIAQRAERSPEHVLRQVLHVVDVFLYARRRRESASASSSASRCLRGRECTSRSSRAGRTSWSAARISPCRSCRRAPPRRRNRASSPPSSASRNPWRRRISSAFRIGTDDPPGVTAFSLRPFQHAAADVVDHLHQVVAHGQFVHAGLVQVSAQAEQARTAVLRRAQARRTTRRRPA